MFVRRDWLAVLLLGVVLVSAGCSQTGPARFAAPTIPAGTWEGQGTCVAYERIGAAGEGTSPTSRSQEVGSYDTHLDIAKQTLFGREAVIVEIRSKRGRLLDSKETETHFRLLLLRLEKMSGGNTLYALGMLEFDPKGPPDYAAQEARIRSRMEVPSAHCVQVGAHTCLQVHYLLPEGDKRWTFKDTFIFTGSGVLKTGSFAATDEKKREGQAPKRGVRQIYWAEQLRPAR